MGLRNTFGTVITDINRNNTVYADSTNAYPEPSGGTISLISGTEYIGTNTLVFNSFLDIPSSGQISLSSLNSTANTTTLKGITGDIARFDLTNFVAISSDGLEKFFDLTAAAGLVPAITVNTSRIQGFDSIGTIDGANVFFENIGMLLNGGGLTINDGAIVQMSEVLFLGHTGDHIILTGTLTEGTFDKIVATPSTGDAVYNIDSALTITNKITITNNLFSDAAGGTLFDAAGKDQTDPKVVAFNNGNALDSYWVGSTGFTGGSTATVLADTVTFVKIAGTYVDGYSERFSFVAGVGTYDGLEDIYVDFSGSAKIILEPGVEEDVIQISLFKNGSEITTTRVEQTLTAVFQTPTSPEFNPRDNVLLENGDTFEIRMRNTTNATNVTATDVKIMVRK